MTRLNIFKDGKLCLTVRLARDRLLIGRSSQCDVQLPDRRISRVHASLEREEEGRFWIEDSSTNGTRVNWEPLVERALLEPGSRIYIHDYVLVLETEESTRDRYRSEEITGFLPPVRPESGVVAGRA